MSQILRKDPQSFISFERHTYVVMYGHYSRRGTGDIGSLILLGICWPYNSLVITRSWIISILLCSWRQLGLVLSAIVFVLILPQTPIGSLSFFSTPYHRRRCLFTLQMLDWKVHFYMSLGYPRPKLFSPTHLSLGRSMWLVLYDF